MLKFSDYHTKIFEDLEKKSTQVPDTLVALGAGLSRTGTLSLKAALTELLHGRCAHGIDTLAGDQEDIDVVVKATAGEMEPEDWRNYFLGKKYVAAVDIPFNINYKEIMKAFPNVKIILTTRDPKTWYQSIKRLFDFHGLQEQTWAFRLITKGGSITHT